MILMENNLNMWGLIQKNYFPAHSNILLIHTGGLQGVFGMNERLKNKQLPTINIDV